MFLTVATPEHVSMHRVSTKVKFEKSLKKFDAMYIGRHLIALLRILKTGYVFKYHCANISFMPNRIMIRSPCRPVPFLNVEFPKILFYGVGCMGTCIIMHPDEYFKSYEAALWHNLFLKNISTVPDGSYTLITASSIRLSKLMPV